ncbi:LLM class flavin-dependent oxidoreductase [Gordonia sp. HY002]|uniref:LLM class flavin-dependent oxidoreductase n=1 Tax=Gordonia zhenghanii TaxID=2911516 RepID=UPI001EF15D2D|nr:LLM class flavin-dependent oxidoreductase [Gordonia zhenghanii]MCF8572363.1 LLM class flavin-dependent oxidoreductase [Gordonia zhenghanii]MCF8608470.1 LLM class flavin-dependent oxidoreductase [Gordonia zhenghanii]
MPDYGHDPRFGVFVTPTSASPLRPVQLAVVAEQAGLDLVSIQDHPYQSKLLDAWTLLSFIAARTERISLSGNVINLPLRPPAVLARAAASLDLLSEGRLEMAIGAGGFADAIEAMGGPRRSRGEARRALAEAIDVMRELWDTSTRTGVHFLGSHYTVDGAKRGPQPAHPISIWVGGYGPRMLEMIGRKADGWLPSLSFLPNGVDDLIAMNARIDASAERAGRNPGDIRRILNVGGAFDDTRDGLLSGGPESWAADLTTLATDHGVSDFVFATDDADTIRRIGAEVAPTTRESVHAARG